MTVKEELRHVDRLSEDDATKRSTMFAGSPTEARRWPKPSWRSSARARPPSRGASTSPLMICNARCAGEL